MIVFQESTFDCIRLNTATKKYRIYGFQILKKKLETINSNEGEKGAKKTQKTQKPGHIESKI